MPFPRVHPRISARRPTALAASAALAAGLLMAVPTTAAAAPTVLDGSSADRAAVSCWEIKQIKPQAADGRYWLLTPQLRAPERFYCDMTTDGGGWVLVGRGRDGWKTAYNGRGSVESVSSTISGTAAFSPRQLDANVINALMGGKRLDQASPELRVRRARDSAGTTWQEVRATISDAERWTWALGAGVPLSRVTFNGSSAVTNTTTRDVRSNNTWNRMWTFDSATNNWQRGFNYGSDVTGSGASTSHLYSSASSRRAPTPFAQVYLRPKLRKADVSFAQIPQQGTSAVRLPAVPNNGVESSDWGVRGLGAGGASENASEVQAFAQIGDTMYVGGNFTQVVNSSGSQVIAQPYLAAFDATTGAYKSSFRPPALNSHVKALAALPGNRLAVGGEFTTVGGQQRAGLVVLNATTGSRDTQWSVAIENKLSGGIESIRALDVGGDYLYLGGAMTHFDTPGGEVYAKGGGRIRISTRTPDPGWNPELNGTATALDVSTDGSRVYYAGYFTDSRGQLADRAAAFSTASGGARIGSSWRPTFSTSGPRKYQQAIREVGGKVWLGGSQHSMFAYDRTTFALENAHVTKAGGDLQAIDEGDGIVYGGCHCEHYNLSDMVDYDSYNPGDTNPPWRYADAIYYIGAWDAQTGDYAPDFSPEMRARLGRGVWAIEVADDGTVWAGGTLQSAVTTSGSNGWAGGFVRFTMRDSTPPTRPAGLSAALEGTDATVSWNESSGATAYEVLRNDRVVATVTGTTATVPDTASTDRFFVRARDERGNRSASTSGVLPEESVETTTLLPAGSTWAYRFEDAPVPAGWKDPGFDVSTWSRGAAPLGFGDDANATDIDVPAGERRAVVSYYRNTFTIPAGMTVGDVTVTTVADDGVAVYVNGTEIGRANLDDGPLGDSSYARSAPRTTAAMADPVTFTIPQALLRRGENTIAVSSHSMWRATPDSSMQATVVAEAGDVAPPSGGSESTVVIKDNDTWRYLFDPQVEPPSTWYRSTAGTSTWSTGAGALGWGSSDVRTDIDRPDRALTSYYQRSFRIDDPAELARLTLTARADDGVAIYVNGTEVNRTRLPQGTLTSGTYATSAVSDTQAAADPVELDVPLSLLNAGTNLVAVEVHSNYRSANSHVMYLRLVAQWR